MAAIKSAITMYGRPTLRERGWTDAMIVQFLGLPDAEAPNPHYKCAPPRKLYLIERVERIEKSRAFRAARGKAEARQAAAARALGTKLAKLERYLTELCIDVEVLSDRELTARACNHYNMRQANRDEWHAPSAAGPDSSPAFLERISVNYLRHRCTGYEAELLRLHGRAGAERGALTLKRKVLEAIAAVYPRLARECERQMPTIGDLRSGSHAGS